MLDATEFVVDLHVAVRPGRIRHDQEFLGGIGFGGSSPLAATWGHREKTRLDAWSRRADVLCAVVSYVVQ